MASRRTRTPRACPCRPTAIGAISDLGYELRKNVDRSYRRGAEGDLTWQATPTLALVGTVSVTDARIRDYRDDASGRVASTMT